MQGFFFGYSNRFFLKKENSEQVSYFVKNQKELAHLLKKSTLVEQPITPRHTPLQKPYKNPRQQQK